MKEAMSNSFSDSKRGIAAGSIFAIVGILVLTVLTTSYLPAAGQTAATVTTTTMACPKVGQVPLWGSDAPAAGWFYYLQYRASDGSIYTIEAQPACTVESLLVNAGAMGSNNATAIAAALGVPSGNLVLQMNGNPYLVVMTTNGYTNAFYVNLQTSQITLKPGITFSDNYENAYYNGEPITNGTQIPLPPQ
jgi:hypothetical protein